MSILSQFPGGGGTTVTFSSFYTEEPLTQRFPQILSQGRQALAGASVGGYALFAGGGEGSSKVEAVDAYNAALTRSTPTALSWSRSGLAGASAGNYALFAGGGGYNGGSSAYLATVDAYSVGLTRTTPTALSRRRAYLAGASVSSYVLFAGGYDGSDRAEVDAYNAALTRTTPTGLWIARAHLAGASVGSYALFAGGGNSQSTTLTYSTVDTYDSSLTRITTTMNLSQERGYLKGASVGNYALFAGGGDANGSTHYATVDAYNSALTRSTPTALSRARRDLAGASGGSYALFAGGYYNEMNGSGDRYAGVVDAYNAALQRTTPAELSQARHGLAGASAGNYVIFAGGFGYDNAGGNSALDTADAYTGDYSYSVLLPANTAYRFGGAAQETVTASDVTLTGTGKLNGYCRLQGNITLTGKH